MDEQEELQPPGAASGGQQGAQKAAASADSAMQARSGRFKRRPICVALPLWCT